MQHGNDPIDIIEFLRRHPNLVELTLLGYGKYNLSSIGECCPELTKLTIRERAIKNCDLLPIAELVKLTALKITTECNKHLPIEMLNTMKSSNSLEVLVLSGYSPVRNVQVKFVAALARFTMLQELSFAFPDRVKDIHLAGLHCLTELRILHVGVVLWSVTGDGIVNLVQHLHNLQQLSLHPHPAIPRQSIQLEKATYLRICEICCNRNQKLTISNFDNKSVRKKESIVEPFAGDGQQTFVQYMLTTMETEIVISI